MRGSGASDGQLPSSELTRRSNLANACPLLHFGRKLGQRHSAVRSSRRLWPLIAVECVLLLLLCQSPPFPAESSDDRLVAQICTSKVKVSTFFKEIEKAKSQSAQQCINSPDYVGEGGRNNSERAKANCEELCEINPGNLTVNFTDFRFYAEFAVENAQLLSSLVAHLPLPDLVWPVGVDSFANRSCDELGTLNFFAGGNSLFIVRATSSALTENIFAAGACLGNGLYNGSECFYQPRDTSMDITRPIGPQHYSAYRQVNGVNETGPSWFETPRNWILKYNTSARAAWLGGACRRLCPDGDSTLLASMEHCQIPDNITCPVLTRYSDDLWIKPYFDCILGFIWTVTYGAPMALYRNKTVHFIGMAGIDVMLENIPIDQCATGTVGGYSAVFADTHMCDVGTSVCRPRRSANGSQLVNGRYVCVCNAGFYYPHNARNSSEIDGLTLVALASHLNASDCDESRGMLHLFRCAKCPNLCKKCTASTDDCRYRTNPAIMVPFHVLNAAAVLFVVAMLVFVVVRRGEGAIRSASWQFLVVILAGCLVAFTGLFGSTYPLDVTCTLFDWTTEVGFILAYGSILLKSWRIEQIFSNKAMLKPRRKPHLKNQDLAVYLVVLVAMVCLILAGATAFNLLAAEDGEVDVDGKHEPEYFKRCSHGSFLYVTLGVHIIVLLSSCYLCFKLRRVLNSYAESREISVIVYFSCLIEVISFIGKLLLETTPDIQYVVRSIELLFLFGAMPAVLFLPKVRKVQWPTREEVAMNKATTAQMRLLRSTSATAMRRRGTVSLDSIHRDSILDWALQQQQQQQTSPGPNGGGGGPPVLAVRYNRRRISQDHSSFFGSRTSSFMGSSDFVAGKSVAATDSQPKSRRQRSASVVLPAVSLALPEHLRKPTSSSSRNFSSGRSGGSFGSILEEHRSTGSDGCPLSPSVFSMTSADVVVFPACTIAPSLSGVSIGSHDLERRHSTPAFLGDRCSAAAAAAGPKARELQIPSISVTSRCSDVLEVDDDEAPAPPSAVLSAVETQCR